VLHRWFNTVFKDELRVFIYPQRILLLHLKRTFKNGFKQELAHQQFVDLPQKKEISGNEAAQWNGLVLTLKQVLQAKYWQALAKNGTYTKVIIYNHLIKYTVIPWSKALAIESERQAYMQHRFKIAYGEAAKAWDLCMDEPAFGQASIASGVCSVLLKELHQVFEQQGIDVNAIYPHLMLAGNQMLKHIKKQKNKHHFWFVVIESDRVCLSLIDNGEWRFIRNIAAGEDVAKQVDDLIQREVVISNTNSQLPIFWYGKAPVVSNAHKADSRHIKIKLHDFELLNQQLEKRFESWVAA